MDFHYRFHWKAACLTILLILTACGSPQVSVVTATPEPTLAGQTIVTGFCKLSPQSVQVSQRYPIGCTKSVPNCMEMNEGEQLLLVYLKANSGCDLEQLAESLMMAKDIFLLAPDGSKSERLILGVEKDILVAGFSLKTSPDNLLLVWGKNPMVKLPKISP